MLCRIFLSGMDMSGTTLPLGSGEKVLGNLKWTDFMFLLSQITVQAWLTFAMYCILHTPQALAMVQIASYFYILEYCHILSKEEEVNIVFKH